MITNEYIDEMATYARWQNENIYQNCEEIGPEERKRDRGMFFGSIHNTLDHICVVNRSILTFLNGALPERNPPGQAVWPDWDELKSIRLEHDNLLSAGAREWTEDWLAEKTTPRDLQVDNFPSIPRWVMVVQLFNHQTHHRSQVTSALHSMGIDYGATDIPWRPGAGYFAGQSTTSRQCVVEKKDCLVCNLNKARLRTDVRAGLSVARRYHSTATSTRPKIGAQKLRRHSKECRVCGSY